MTMVRRTVSLPPELDAFIERDRTAKGWTRSLWLQELLKEQIKNIRSAGFFVDSIPTESRSIVNGRTEKAG